MSITVGSNLAGANANRGLWQASKQKNKALESLSTGLRINKGSDDPSGLLISEMLRSQISGSQRALRNTQEASNVMSIAEGGLSSVSSMLNNMKSLAVHSMNTGVTGRDQTAANQMEMNSLLTSISRVTSTTNYAGQNLLDGSSENMELQLGEGSGEQNRDTASLGNYSSAALGTVEYEGETYSINDLYGGGAASLANNPELAVKIIDQAISDVSSGRAEIGAYQANTLDANAANLAVEIETLTASESAIRDTDMAEAMTNFIKNKLLEDSSVRTMQSARMNSQNVLSLLSGLNTSGQ